MAHRLFQRADESYAFVSTRKEWHSQLTNHTISDKPMTAVEALELSGMANMELLESELFSTLDGEQHTYEGQKGILLRDSAMDTVTPVTVVGARRKITQFEDLVYPMDALADASGGTIETFGLLSPGDEWFATIKLPETVTIGGDEHIQYVWGRDSLHGIYIVSGTLFRVVCGNTNQMALLNAQRSGFANAYRMPHTSGARVDIEAIRGAIGMTFGFATELDEIAKLLLDQELVDIEFAAITDNLFGVPEPDKITGKVPTRALTMYRKRNNELSSLLEAPTQWSTYRKGHATKWTAFQAISEYVDWRQPVKGADKEIRRLERTMDSSVHRIKTRALEALL